MLEEKDCWKCWWFEQKNGLKILRIQKLGLEINPNNAASNFRIRNEVHIRSDGGDGSYNPNNLLFSLHSHPLGNNNLGPSGWISRLQVGNKYNYDSGNLGGDCSSMLIHLNINPNTKHYIYHESNQKLIYYDQNTAANKRIQNRQGISIGTVKSAILMRNIILNRSK